MLVIGLDDQGIKCEKRWAIIMYYHVLLHNCIQKNKV